MPTIEIFIFYVFLAVFTFFVARKDNWEKTFEYLGLTKKKFSAKHLVMHSIALFVLLFLVLTVEAMVLSALSLDDSDKVSMVLAGLSLPALIVAVTIGPFAEEVFFRGFVQKYAGVVITSLLFGLLHYSFGSVTELIGAFTAGIILGYWVKYKNQFLWPAIIAHSAYNLVSIILVFSL